MSKNTTLEDFKMISLAKEKEYLDLEEGGGGFDPGISGPRTHRRYAVDL